MTKLFFILKVLGLWYVKLLLPRSLTLIKSLKVLWDFTLKDFKFFLLINFLILNGVFDHIFILFLLFFKSLIKSFFNDLFIFWRKFWLWLWCFNNLPIYTKFLWCYTPAKSFTHFHVLLHLFLPNFFLQILI